MKRLLCILISVLIILSSSVFTTYAKDGNGKHKKNKNYKNYSYSYLKLNEDNGEGNDEIHYLKDQIKEYNKDYKQQQKLLKKMKNVISDDEENDFTLMLLDGVKIIADDPSMIRYGKVMIPIKGLMDALGADMKYNPQTKMLVITKNNMKIEMKIGSKKIWINGVEMKLDIHPMDSKKRVFVSMDIIARIFNLTINWDKVGTMIIETNKTVKEVISLNDNDISAGSNRFEYTGNWSYVVPQTGAYKDDNHLSLTAEASYQVKFTGTKIKLYGATAPDYGICAISIDGGKEKYVDCYSQTRVNNTLLYDSPELLNQQHILKVRVTGAKNLNSTNYFINADRADITTLKLVVPAPTNPAQPVPAPTSTPVDVTTTINYNVFGTGNNQFQYSGIWDHVISAYKYYQSNKTDAFCQIKFTGKQIKLYGLKDTSCGIAEISLDGVLQQTIDCYPTSVPPVRQDDVLLFTSPLMTEGQHLLKIRVTGTKNINSANYYIGLTKAEIISTAPNINLALNRPAVASSSDDASRTAEKAVDGRADTCWNSLYTDPQWIYVILDSQKSISRVRLNWEVSYGRAYRIQVSNDANTWTDVYITTAGDGGIDDITFAPVNAIFVRLYAEQSATQLGYSLKEFEVY